MNVGQVEISTAGFGEIESSFAAIGVLCDEFEQSLLAGDRPRMRDYLSRVESSLRPRLFTELLAVESYHCFMKNLPDPVADLEELIAIFSEDPALIEEIGRQIAARQQAQYHAPPDRLIGQYVLMNKIGEGGFGTVWRARDLKLDRIVAVKVSYAEHDAFLREARAAAGLKHPGIISVHDAGRKGDRTYIVADYVDGWNLREWPDRRKIEAAGAARLCWKLAQALDHAHRAGIIHRDLTPGNIIIDRAGEPHITDFGLAKRLSAPAHQSIGGKVLGTPAYMSPEQADGRSKDVDARSDVYSLGIILYELLTGRVPFQGELTDVLHQTVHVDPLAPRSQNRTIPQDLETICLKAISKEPAERYAGAAEFAADLQRFLDGEPVAARPCGRLQRLRRQLRRRAFSRRTAMLAVLIPAVGVVSWTSARRRSPLPASPQSRNVRVTTVPAGARLALVPIDEMTGRPDSEKAIRPAGPTPLTTGLHPAMYLIVADIPGYGFHEVYRTVPESEDDTSEPYSSFRWEVQSDGTIELPVIQIPREADATAGMVPFRGGEFVMGDENLQSHTLHSVRVEDFFLAPTEITVGEIRSVAGSIPDSYVESGLPEGDEFPITMFSFRDACSHAEQVGKRLPTEEEYEYAATGAGTRTVPWQEGPDQITEWQWGPVGEPAFDRTPTEPPVFGLYSNVAEWTDSWSLPYSLPPGMKLPRSIVKLARESPVVRGGPFSVVERAANMRELNNGPRWRHGVSLYSRHPGLGFRLARSARPRFLN